MKKTNRKHAGLSFARHFTTAAQSPFDMFRYESRSGTCYKCLNCGNSLGCS